MSRESIIALIHESEFLRANLRRCSMIYQYHEKLDAAKAWNKPLTYFDVAYKKWARYRTLLHRKRDAAMAACDKAGYPTGVLCAAEHPLYQRLMGTDNLVQWE